jgi:hypothetical protein
MDSYYVRSPGLDCPYEVAEETVPPFQERHVTSLKSSLTWSITEPSKFQLPTMSLHSSTFIYGHSANTSRAYFIKKNSNWSPKWTIFKFSARSVAFERPARSDFEPQSPSKDQHGRVSNPPTKKFMIIKLRTSLAVKFTPQTVLVCQQNEPMIYA